MAAGETRNAQLAKLLSQLQDLTQNGKLHWDREKGSAHRYARWNNNLLILGPAEPISEAGLPRYLIVTPFNSPACVEINSSDPELGAALMKLIATVERVSSNEPPTDPFAISEEDLDRLVS